jgi:prephenate dehydrogenase
MSNDPPTRFGQITVIGVGLIGGSFALSARRAQIAKTILGWDSPDVLDRARAKGVIDGADLAFEKNLQSEADLVYLATPVRSIIDFLRTRNGSFKPGAVVTDAGSTKRRVCEAAAELLPEGVDFVGGHPMAGSHNAGVESASADLFDNAPYALITDAVPPDLPSSSATRLMARTVSTLGSRPVFLSAAKHDYLVARTSHLPQLLSTVMSLVDSRSAEGEAVELAGSAFESMSRLGASRWTVWEDICATNADEISAALGEIIRQLELFRSGLDRGDLSALRDGFRTANEFIKRYHGTKQR